MTTRIIATKQHLSIDLEPKLLKLTLANKDQCQFVVVNGNLLQIQRFTTGTNSMIVGNNVSKDGALYTTTKYDALFILLPILKSGCSDQYRPLDDLLYESNQPDLLQLVQELPSITLESICSVKIIDEVSYYRYDQEKTTNWLDKKFQNLLNVVPNTCCLAQNLTHKTVHEVVLALLAENIDKDLQEILKLKYDIQSKVQDENHFEVKMLDKKRVDGPKAAVGAKKKLKQMPAQKQKITDFFKKRA